VSGVAALVVAALRAEVAPLVRRLDGRRRGAAGGVRWVRGLVGGRSVVVAWTGDGAACAGRGLEVLLGRFRPARLVIAGVAGALSPELAAGSLIAARRVYDRDRPAPDPDAGLVAAAGRCGVRPGVVLSSPDVAVTADDKAQLWRRLAQPPAAAVDLETAAFAGVAAAQGVPYLALRAISDTAAESLPLDFNRLRDRRGRVSRVAVIARTLRRPSLVPALFALQRRVSRCAEHLAAAVEAVLRETT